VARGALRPGLLIRPRCAPRNPGDAAIRDVIRFFVTPEAKGYAGFMRSRFPFIRRLVACAAVAALSAGAGATTLYRWVDAQGVVHYSDRPAPGAEKFEVAGSSGKSAGSTSTAQSGAPRVVQKRPQDLYSRLEITSPTEGQVFYTADRIPASAAVEPELASGHQIWFVLDGIRQTGNDGASLAASLEAERGSHTLTALITDADGRQLMASPPVNFVMRQNSTASPPTGPLIPPKKPKF